MAILGLECRPCATGGLPTEHDREGVGEMADGAAASVDVAGGLQPAYLVPERIASRRARGDGPALHSNGDCPRNRAALPGARGVVGRRVGRRFGWRAGWRGPTKRGRTPFRAPASHLT